VFVIVKASRLLERGNPLGEVWGTKTGKKSRDEWVLLPLRDEADGRGLRMDEKCIQPKNDGMSIRLEEM
jgi:hypothetical protein